jgi:UV DNA damage endonuclease
MLAWWDEFPAEFAALARIIRDHDMRVTMHPGQFTVLNSADPRVVEAAVAEVGWHVRLLDRLGAVGAVKIVIHVGGAAGG